MALKAIVENGYLRLKQPVDLPDGTELSLVFDDEAGTMTASEFARLDECLVRAASALDAGEGVDGELLLARLHAKQ
jgi:predicted DNA-binding antitoxin AbrB/MazE fold protein